MAPYGLCITTAPHWLFQMSVSGQPGVTKARPASPRPAPPRQTAAAESYTAMRPHRACAITRQTRCTARQPRDEKFAARRAHPSLANYRKLESSVLFDVFQSKLRLFKRDHATRWVRVRVWVCRGGASDSSLCVYPQTAPSMSRSPPRPAPPRAATPRHDPPRLAALNPVPTNPGKHP